MNKKSRFLTPVGYAKVYGCSHSYIYKLIKLGKIEPDIMKTPDGKEKKYINLSKYPIIKGEVFKDIDGFPNYQASNLGNIRNKETKKVLSQFKSQYGYYLVGIPDSKGCVSNRLVHRLVSIAFIKNTMNKPFVNHIDGNRINNNVDNLEWCTHHENLSHAAQRRRNFKKEKP